MSIKLNKIFKFLNLLTDDASIELYPHGHPSTIGSGMYTDISSNDWSVKGMSYHNVSVIVSSE